MKKLQSGRSMIEMLGVLAIIGVLSVGGLTAYTSAMDRHDANKILDYAAKCAVIARTDGTVGSAYTCVDTNGDKVGGAEEAGITAATATYTDDDTPIAVSITAADKADALEIAEDKTASNNDLRINES